MIGICGFKLAKTGEMVHQRGVADLSSLGFCFLGVVFRAFCKENELCSCVSISGRDRRK